MFRDKNSGVSMCIRDVFKLWKKSENSIEVVSLDTFQAVNLRHGSSDLRQPRKEAERIVE